ncbi:MAG TPA: DUF2892 domain-containing protein [Allosphingosinicella sp.]|jgi:hypothetical protein|nr:DUF2892 domain-containing protein [Allosphingosinicella sp.]
MVCNVGGPERALRLVVGVAALAAALLLELETVWRIALFVIAAIGFLTAASRYCPLNSIIGRNSCRKT